MTKAISVFSNFNTRAYAELAGFASPAQKRWIGCIPNHEVHYKKIHHKTRSFFEKWSLVRYDEKGRVSLTREGQYLHYCIFGEDP